MGKPLGSPLPLGAVIGKKEIMECNVGQRVFSIPCAASIANIKITLNNNLVENSLKKGSYLIKRLKEFQEQHEIIGDVRG